MDEVNTAENTTERQKVSEYLTPRQCLPSIFNEKVLIAKNLLN